MKNSRWLPVDKCMTYITLHTQRGAIVRKNRWILCAGQPYPACINQPCHTRYCFSEKNPNDCLILNKIVWLYKRWYCYACSDCHWTSQPQPLNSQCSAAVNFSGLYFQKWNKRKNPRSIPLPIFKLKCLRCKEHFSMQEIKKQVVKLRKIQLSVLYLSRDN